VIVISPFSVMITDKRAEPEDLRGDLMDSAQGTTRHQPAASPATDRATVYIETSRSAKQE
jgi:hypothetical protein